jgi:hypothetical protein
VLPEWHFIFYSPYLASLCRYDSSGDEKSDVILKERERKNRKRVGRADLGSNTV